MPPHRDQLLTVTDVLHVTGFKSRTTLYRRARSGGFPCPCHIVELERLIDRTLFTSCAAYAYARNLALGTRRPDDAIAAEALAAFERQRAIALEALS